MKKKEKILSALLAVFPNLETFSRFSENIDNNKALHKGLGGYSFLGGG